MIRRALLSTAALVVATVVSTGPAQAASPSVSLKQCNKLGGVFSQSQGTKYCRDFPYQAGTTTTTVTRVGATTTTEFEVFHLEGVSSISTPYTQTANLTQKNNGLVVQTVNAPVNGTPTSTPVSCTLYLTDIFGDSSITPRPLSECADQDLFA